MQSNVEDFAAIGDKWSGKSEGARKLILNHLPERVFNQSADTNARMSVMVDEELS